MSADRTEEALRDAISETDNDIFNAAFGQKPEDETAEDVSTLAAEDPDEAEDTETEETEVETEPQEETAEEAETAEETVEAAAKPGEEKPAPQQQPKGLVPPGRLREQTERATKAEAALAEANAAIETLKTGSQTEIAELKGKFDGLAAMLQRLTPQQQQPAKTESEAETVPDMFEDPKGYADYQDKKLNERLAPVVQSIQTQRVETSMMLAHAMHKDVFEKAIGDLQKLNPQNPDDRVTVQRIYASPNPGQALVDWHKRQATLREVGDDPAKFREKVAEDTRKALMADPEFRKQLLAELQAEAGGSNNGRPNTITRLPPNLARAPGRGASGEAIVVDGSEQGIFESAFAK